MDNGTDALIVRGQVVLAGDGPGRHLRDGAVLVRGREIAAVGPWAEIAAAAPGARVTGGADQLVMPGLIDAHSHGRGLSPLQKGVPYDFLENYLFDLAGMISLPPDLASALTAVRHLRRGITMIHHNGWDNDGPAALADARAAISAYRASGIRLAYSPGTRNMNRLACDEQEFVASLPPELAEVARPMIAYDPQQLEDDYFALFAALHEEFDSERTRILLSPSWAHGVTDSFLRRTRAVSDRLGGIGVHIHTLQTPHQRAYGLKRFGKSLVGRLDDFALVDRHLTLGHAGWASEVDIARLGEAGAGVTHHPSCNLHVRNGITPVHAMVAAGVTVAMGLDDKSINDDDDPFMEMRLIHELHRLPALDLRARSFDAHQVLAMATVNGARVCGLEGRLGRLAPGMLADIVTLPWASLADDPWVDPRLDPGELMLHRARGAEVRNVVVDGRVVIENGAFTGYDVEGLFRAVRDFAARGLTEKQAHFAAALGRLRPFYQSWHNEFLKWLDVSEPFYMLNGRR